LPSPARLDLVRGLDDVMVGEDVALGADDHARAQARGALRLLFEAVAEEMPEQGIVEKGWRCALIPCS